MESRYVVLNVFDLSEFMMECRRLGIKFAYIAKIEKRKPVKFDGGYVIPHQEFYVLTTSFSFQEGILLKLKGAYALVDITFADTWKEETDSKEKQRYEAARITALNTYENWKNQLKEWFYVGQGFLTLGGEPEAISQ